MSQTVRFPFEKTVKPLPNDPVMEFMFAALIGYPPARQKSLIMQAREARITDDAQTSVLIDSLDLKGA